MDLFFNSNYYVCWLGITFLTSNYLLCRIYYSTCNATNPTHSRRLSEIRPSSAEAINAQISVTSLKRLLEVKHMLKESRLSFSPPLFLYFLVFHKISIFSARTFRMKLNCSNSCSRVIHEPLNRVQKQLSKILK